jgi:hypothetical protein
VASNAAAAAEMLDVVECLCAAGLCYGKAEAAVLAVLLPLLCLSHLGGEEHTSLCHSLCHTFHDQP